VWVRFLLSLDLVKFSRRQLRVRIVTKEKHLPPAYLALTPRGLKYRRSCQRSVVHNLNTTNNHQRKYYLSSFIPQSFCYGGNTGVIFWGVWYFYIARHPSVSSQCVLHWRRELPTSSPPTLKPEPYFSSSFAGGFGILPQMGVVFGRINLLGILVKPVLLRDSSIYTAYLNNWSLLLVHRFFLRSFGGNSLPNIYFLSKKHFLRNNFFYPGTSGQLVFRSLVHVSSPTTLYIVGANTVIRGNTFFYSHLKKISKFSLVSWSFIRKLYPPFKLKLHFSPKFYRRLVRSSRSKKLKCVNLSRTIVRIFRGNYKVFSGFAKPKTTKKFSTKLIKIPAVCSNYYTSLPRKVFFLPNKGLRAGVESLRQLSTTGFHSQYPKYSIYSNLGFFLKKGILFSLFVRASVFLKIAFMANVGCSSVLHLKYAGYLSNKYFKKFRISNLIPNHHFNLALTKRIYSLRSTFFLKENLVGWVYNNLIRFMEFCSGKKVLLQFFFF